MKTLKVVLRQRYIYFDFTVMSKRRKMKGVGVIIIKMLLFHIKTDSLLKYEAGARRQNPRLFMG